MAEEVKDDPYELGNTDYVIETPDKPKAKPVPAEGPSNIIDIGKEQPRNPDGTFAPKPITQVTAAAVAPPEPPAPERPPAYLVQAARDFGFSDEDIAAMPIPALRKTVFLAQQRMLKVRQNLARERTIQEGEVKKPQPVDELEFEVNEDELHPSLVPPLKLLREHAKKTRDENKALREELKELRTRDEQRELNRAAAVFDAAFAALGDDFKAIVGEGAGRDMDPQSAEYMSRISILTHAQADPRTQTVAQIKAKVKDVAEKMFRRVVTKPKAKEDAYAEVPNGAQRISPKEWAEAGLARPTARKVDDEPPSEQKAVRNLTAKMNQEVIPDSEELDGFL